MDSFFRAVAIGLGVLLGTFHPGVDPKLNVSLHRGDNLVMVSAYLESAVSPKMEEALLAGVPLSLTLVTEVDGHPGATVDQVLGFLVLTRQWQVSRSGQPPRLYPSLAEAEKDWCTWVDVAAGVPTVRAFTVSVAASLTFPGRPEWQSDMVWKASVVTWTRSFTQMSEIPF